jgi:Ca2+-binding RTX toxin-like protein
VLEPHPHGYRNLVRRTVAAGAALALAAFVVGLSAAPAWAVTCSGGATMTINLADGESVSLSLSGDADPRSIRVTPADPTCGGFDTSTVTTIQVNGGSGNETLTIDQAGSVPFPHEDTASIVLALGGGSNTLVITGQEAADTIGLGANGIGLGAAQTPDVTGVGTVESLMIHAGGGSDVVSGLGDGGLGGAFTSGLTIDGEAQDDTLTGGNGDDTIDGGDGGDVIKGRLGDDVLEGNVGDDDANGGDGKDTVSGSGGADVVSGGDGEDAIDAGKGDDAINGGEAGDTLAAGPGNDALRGGRGNDDLDGGPGNDQLRGGSGRDDCHGGPGADSFTGCEKITL